MHTKWAGNWALSALAAVAVSIIFASGAYAQVHGAIFMTDEFGTIVEAQHYLDKEDVYVNGGPAKPGAAGIPDGQYHIKITNPSGSKLLGDSVIRFGPGGPPITVVGGEFIQLYKVWDIVAYQNGGGPFKEGYKDTDNKGGVYKCWISMDPNYAHHLTKTKTFKVKKNGGGQLPPDTFIQAYKFRDTNGNGVWDQPEELPIPGWTIELYLQGGGLVDTMVTDGGGFVEFVVPLSNTDLYTVKEVIPGGQGWAATTLEAFPNIPADNTQQPVYFGNWKPITLCAFKFRDTNGNGTWDNGENPISGWQFNVYRLPGPVLVEANVTTNASGKACLSNPVDNDGTQYKWVEIIPPGLNWVPTTFISGETTITTGDPDPEFGNWKPTMICGYKFYDANGDGIENGSDVKIVGWRIVIRLAATNAIVGCGLTGADGKFCIGPVDGDGTLYKVEELMAAPYTNTTDLFQVVGASAPETVVKFGNVVKTQIFEDAYTIGGWHNSAVGFPLTALCEPTWRTGLNSLFLHNPPADNSTTNSGIYQVPLGGTHAAAHADFADWIVGNGVIGDMAYNMSRQLAGCWLNVHCGNFKSYPAVWVYWKGNLVNIEDVFNEARAILNNGGDVIKSGHPDFQAASDLHAFFGAFNEDLIATYSYSPVPVPFVAPPCPLS